MITRMEEERKNPEPEYPGFLKTSAEPEPKTRRVAKFLVLIGSGRAAEILSRLPPADVEAISKEIAGIKSIGHEEGAAVLDEFSVLLSSPFNRSGGACGGGGVEAARQILHTAFGPEKGEELLVRALPETKPNPFDFLEDFSGKEVAIFFKEESAAATAMVLSRLPPKLSAAALTCMDGEKRPGVLRRIAKQAAVPPEVLEQTAAVLREKARHFRRTEEINLNGMETLAAILKSAGAGFGDRLLSSLEAEDPELGKTLKEKIYTLADVLRAADLPVQKKLASMDNKTVIRLLKARTGEDDTAAWREKILSNLSHLRRADVLEEESITGPVPKKDIEEAARAFLAWFRRGREEGGIIMMDDDDLV